MRLGGKTAIITGGARGIGAAICELFVKEGACVIITDVLDAEGQELAQKLGDKTVFLQQDVRDEVRWQAILGEATTKFSAPDILVNNAGVLHFSALEDFKTEDIRRILDVNLYGTILGTQIVGKAMKETGGGSIINMSSADGLSAANGLGPYVASKWGVRGFTKAAALEFGPHKVRVNSIHPGGVDTPMANPSEVKREHFDMGFKVYAAQRACDPMEIAHGALYFASDESGYCMGSELAIDGGLSTGHYYFGMPGAPET